MTLAAVPTKKTEVTATMDDNEIDIHLGRRLRRRRRLLGLTQQELADACGVGFQQIQKYECAANRVNAVRLWQLAEALEVSVNYFFEGLPSKRNVSPLDRAA
jgi:transcriptional regulator with XRE-family HTH domain